MRKNSIFYCSFLTIIIISLFLWPFVTLPYVETTVVGEYKIKEYNQHNDLVRYLVFILIPTLALFFYKFFIEKVQFNQFFSKFYLDEDSKKLDEKNLIILFFIFCLILLVRFLYIEFPINQIDSYHEGQLMSSAFKYYLDGSLWSGSHVTVGIFYETISSKLIWDFFNDISIGSTRFLKLFYIFIFKFLLLILSYQVSKTLKLKYNLNLIFFIFLSLVCINLNDYNDHVGQLTHRDIVVVLSIIFFFQIILNYKHCKYIILLIGPLSVFSILWSIDRGLIVNLIFLIIAIYFLIIKKYIYAFSLILNIILFWLIAYIYLGDEFNFFIQNTISILEQGNQVGGIVHPLPLSSEPNSSRAAKSLVLISFSLIISLNLLSQRESFFSNKFVLMLSIISFVSFLTYSYALGRSDGPHIKSTFGYSVIFFSMLLLYLFLIFLEKKIIIRRFLKSINVLFIVFFLSTFIILSDLNLKNVINFKSRLDTYVSLPDEIFLNNATKSFVSNSEKILKNYDCIQLYSLDVMMIYLLKKKNCGKFYFISLVGSKKNQERLIKELNRTQILLSDNYNEFLSPKNLIKDVDGYVNNSFLELYKEGNWIISKKK